MTRPEIMALGGRELDKAIANAVGWKTILRVGTGEMHGAFPPDEVALLGTLTDGFILAPLTGGAPGHLPAYSTSLDAVRAAEDEIEKRGWSVMSAYVDFVSGMVRAPKTSISSNPAICFMWPVLRADATTRARAILLTLEGE